MYEEVGFFCVVEELVKAPLPERWFLMSEYFGRVAADQNETQGRRDEASLLAAFFLAKAIEYERPKEP